MRPKIKMFTVVAVTLVMAGIAPYTASAQQDPPSPQDPAADRGPKSQSPALQIPAHLQNLPAIVPPQERAVKLPIDSLATDVYEVESQRSWQIPNTSPLAAEAPDAGPRAVPGYQGLLPGADDLEGRPQPLSIIGVDGRVEITNTTVFPWRTVVQIVVNFPTGSGTCTGEMIDAFNIFTAGHCVHNGTSWANSLQVFPGRSGSYTPYNHAWATYFRSYTNWTVNQDHQHDWAVVTLDRRVGNFTGWMGRITAPWWSGIYTGTANNAGYPDLAPGGAGGGARMYFDADNGRTANENNHWYYNDTRPGNSGGPVWYYDGTNRYIMTIHAYGNDGSGSNHGTRLNNEKYDRTNAWLAAPPTTPVDRPDLVDDGQAFFYGSPTTVIRGETTMFAGSDVGNIGTLAAGGHWNRYVLSTNTTISTFDYTVCEAFVSSVSAFSWNNSDCSALVSASIPPGLYWLGVIYDVYGAQTEFDENNNTAYKTAYQINVQAKYTLTVAHAGSGSGTVTSSPAGINCGADCSEDYLQNTVVSLTPTAAAGSVFVGWSGACVGSGACNVTMDANKGVTATFSLVYTLTMTKNGSGTVTSAPPGINCGADCTENYAEGTVVALTATPAAGWSFVSWSGGCSGKVNPCNLTMDTSKLVRATFKPTADLQLTKSDSPDPVAVGSILSYQIGVFNAGPNPSSGIKVIDTLPAGLVYVSSAANQGTIATTLVTGGRTKVTWTVGTLPNGGGAKLQIQTRPSVAGTLKNTASVSTSATADPALGNNKATTVTTVNP